MTPPPRSHPRALASGSRTGLRRHGIVGAKLVFWRSDSSRPRPCSQCSRGLGAASVTRAGTLLIRLQFVARRSRKRGDRRRPPPRFRPKRPPSRTPRAGWRRSVRSQARAHYPRAQRPHGRRTERSRRHPKLRPGRLTRAGSRRRSVQSQARQAHSAHACLSGLPRNMPRSTRWPSSDTGRRCSKHCAQSPVSSYRCAGRISTGNSDSRRVHMPGRSGLPLVLARSCATANRSSKAPGSLGDRDSADSALSARQWHGPLKVFVQQFARDSPSRIGVSPPDHEEAPSDRRRS